MATFPRDYSSLRLRLKDNEASSSSPMPKDKRQCLSDEEVHHQLPLNNNNNSTTMSVELAMDTEPKLTDEETSQVIEEQNNDKYLIDKLNLIATTSESSADEYQQQRTSLLIKTHSPHHQQESGGHLSPTDNSSRPPVEQRTRKRIEDIPKNSSCSSSSSSSSGGGDSNFNITTRVNRNHHTNCHQLSPEFRNQQVSSTRQHTSPSKLGVKSNTRRRRKMSPPIKMNDKYLKSSSWRVNIMRRYSFHISDLIDIFIRVIFVIVFCKMETITAFKRFVHLDELPLYQNPRTEDYISPMALLVSVTMGPFLITLIHLLLTKDRTDFRAATWTWTLCLCLNGFATSVLKVSIGRPRPDYYYRCFPDGVMQLKAGIPNAAAASSFGFSGSVPPTLTSLNMMEVFNCTGIWRDINEGRKSFPSGHSSFAFASFGFIAFYLSGKLHAFNRGGRGETWRLCIALTPLVLATLVAVSRTCDYHHHWQDVVVGSLIGLFVSYGVYRLYYPSIFMLDSHKPYSREIRLCSTDLSWSCCHHRQRNRHNRTTSNNPHHPHHYRDVMGASISTNVNRYRRRLQKTANRAVAPLFRYDQEDDDNDDEQYQLLEEEASQETEIFSCNNSGGGGGGDGRHFPPMANEDENKSKRTTAPPSISPQSYLSKCF